MCFVLEMITSEALFLGDSHFKTAPTGTVENIHHLTPQDNVFHKASGPEQMVGCGAMPTPQPRPDWLGDGTTLRVLGNFSSMRLTYGQ